MSSDGDPKRFAASLEYPAVAARTTKKTMIFIQERVKQRVSDQSETGVAMVWRTGSCRSNRRLLRASGGLLDEKEFFQESAVFVMWCVLLLARS